MRRLRLFAGVFALLLVAVVWALPAQAQATRTWVSGVGDDANPCSRTAPCKTFAGSISKTAPGGEINCLDPGGFGGVTITKAITINCVGVIGGVLVASTNGITVAAGPNDRVVLKGLDLEGTGTGLDGIGFSSGATLEIEDVIIRDFNGNGIKVANGASTSVFITDARVIDCGSAGGGAGIALLSSGAFNVFASINDVRLDNNAAGLLVNGAGSSGTLRVTFRNSIAAGSGGNGIFASSGTGALRLLVDGAGVVNNSVGLFSTGASSNILVSNTDITGNQTGLKTASGGSLTSFGNNRFNGNVVTAGAFTGTTAQQ